ncbi:MAG TPA: DinB family protein [Pedobacter sp.]|jgi:hypothetical protein
MIHQAIEKLNEFCTSVPNKLMQLSEEEFTFKRSPGKWSRKELLGHLIDSATNNHQRFVRAQFETAVVFYDGDNWVNVQKYQEENSELLIKLWESYNRHLAYVIKQIPEDKLQRTATGKDGKHLTLAFFIEDYVNHLEHHLKQLLG